MNSEDFEAKARLYVLGSLDEEELLAFEQERRALGDAAERIIQECEHLNSIFALSLRPTPPKADARQRLMDMIKAAGSKPKNQDGNC
jgi:hypothetical protein